MKTLLFTIPLTLFLFSCHTTTYEKDIQSSDFTNYYNQYKSESLGKEVLVQKQEHDTLNLKPKELVIK